LRAIMGLTVDIVTADRSTEQFLEKLIFFVGQPW
jgi:hypothetical protein